jgi:hypothetical protein
MMDREGRHNSHKACSSSILVSPSFGPVAPATTADRMRSALIKFEVTLVTHTSHVHDGDT